MSDIDGRLEFAIQAAREAGDGTLKLFQNKDLSVDRKGDGSPVTVADREAELMLRKLIAENYAEDGIMGEEFDDVPGASGFRWVLDPIDGTKSFIHGVPLYTTLVAVLREGEGLDAADEPVAGVIHAPATGETISAATGGGCWLKTGNQPGIPAKVSGTANLSEALLVTSEVASFATHRTNDDLDVFVNLQREARLARTWGDGYGYLMVASGRADVAIDPIVNLWDIAPMLPIIEEAGGRFTNWQGQRTTHSSDCFATNGLLHDAVLDHTRGR